MPSKKTAPAAEVISSIPNVRNDAEAVTTEVITNVRNELVFGAADTDLAHYLGLNLYASAEDRAEKAVSAYNSATRSMVEAGLLLASVKAELSQEGFMAMLAERGMAFPRAYELMRGAALAARLPLDQREQVLALPKTKVMALANASAAAVEAMLEDGEADLSLIGVRELRQRIKDVEAALADTQVQRDTAEAEAEGLKKKLSKAPVARADGVPLVIADLRAEIAAEAKKIALALDSLNALGLELAMLVGADGAYQWVDGTARLAHSAAVAARVQADGVALKFMGLMPEGEREIAMPVPMSYLTDDEVRECAESWARLTAVHQHEKALREWEREQQRPRGKGRPAAKPVAPDAAAA